MANIQVSISQNGKTTLATAGKYCERDVDINVAVVSAADNMPSYVKSEADALAAKVVSAQGSRVFTLAAITDLHYGNSSYTDGILHASQALAYINKQITLDAFAVLGDYTDGYPVDSIDNAFGDCRKVNSLLAPLEAVPNLRMQGNHDYYADHAQFVHYHIQAYSEGVTWGDKTGGYFYRDFTDKKLRIICVNTTETGNSNLGVSTAQYTWFVGALDLSAKSDAASWSILVLSHHPLDWYDLDSAYRFGYIIDAYNKGTSGTTGSVSYNFAGKNTAALIGNIHGHIHNLLTGYINKGSINTINPTKVLRVCTPEACINRANQYDGAWKEATSYPKTTYSAKDTSFVVYCIDLAAQNIKALCYGAGYDRDISYAPIAPTVYNITNSLTNCTASGATTIVEEGTASVTITARGGYELPDTITVSGASYSWNKTTGVVTLSNPTGDVTITVIAKSMYNNQIPKSINADGSQYVGENGEDGYKLGYRLNSSGTETSGANAAIGTTGYMPVKAGDTVYFKNLKAHRTNTGGWYEQTYISLYDSTFAGKMSQKFCTIKDSDAYLFDNFTMDAEGFITSFRIQDKYNNMVGSGGYFRISAYGMSPDSIITVNEPIGTDVFGITNNLTNCTANGAATIVGNGTTTITIIADSGFELPDTITVSGASYTYDKTAGTIVLSNPTSNITVTVIATEIKVETNNLIKKSINSDGTPYNGGQGWKTGYRINSNGIEESKAGWEVTGFIPVDVNNDTLYFKNVTWQASSPGNDYLGVYDESFTKLTSTKVISEWLANLSQAPSTYGFTMDANNNITAINFNKFAGYQFGSLSSADFRAKAKYVRFSMYEINNDSIITKNEPID